MHCGLTKCHRKYAIQRQLEITKTTKTKTKQKKEIQMRILTHRNLSRRR